MQYHNDSNKLTSNAKHHTLRKQNKPKQQSRGDLMQYHNDSNKLTSNAKHHTLRKQNKPDIVVNNNNQISTHNCYYTIQNGSGGQLV